MTVKELITRLKNLGTVYYTQAEGQAVLPYFVVNDYAEVYDSADNSIDDVRASVQIDYYTKTPFDEKKGEILALLSSLKIIPNYSRYYLNDEKVYQHIFDVEIR